MKECQLEEEGNCVIIAICSLAVTEERDPISDTDLLNRNQDADPSRARLWTTTLGICMLPSLGMQQTLWSLTRSSMFLGIKLSKSHLKPVCKCESLGNLLQIPILIEQQVWSGHWDSKFLQAPKGCSCCWPKDRILFGAERL